MQYKNQLQILNFLIYNMKQIVLLLFVIDIIFLEALLFVKSSYKLQRIC